MKLQIFTLIKEAHILLCWYTGYISLED